MIEASERVLGNAHRLTLSSLNGLAVLYHAQGRDGEAEPLFRRVLETCEQVLGKVHPYTIASLNLLALLYFEQRNWSRAAEFWRRSTVRIIERTRRGSLDTSLDLVGKKKSEVERSSEQFWRLIKVTYRLAPEGELPDRNASRDMFETAQRAQNSEAAASLAQMASRGAKRDAKLAVVVRERQDLMAEWQKREAG